MEISADQIIRLLNAYGIKNPVKAAPFSATQTTDEALQAEGFGALRGFSRENPPGFFRFSNLAGVKALMDYQKQMGKPATIEDALKLGIIEPVDPRLSGTRDYIESLYQEKGFLGTNPALEKENFVANEILKLYNTGKIDKNQAYQLADDVSKQLGLNMFSLEGNRPVKHILYDFLESHEDPTGLMGPSIS